MLLFKIALQDTDFDVRRQTLRSARGAIAYGDYNDVVDLVGLAFGNILNESLE